MSTRRATLVCSVLAVWAAPVGAQSGCANRTLSGCTPQLVATVSRVRALLDSLGGLPTPPDAPAADRPVAVKFSSWLRQSAERVAALAALANKSARPPAAGARAAPVPYSQRAQTLQQKLLAEAVKYSMISNTLKTRHDIAMNAIRNMK
jgi:hypothetical protein